MEQVVIEKKKLLDFYTKLHIFSSCKWINITGIVTAAKADKQKRAHMKENEHITKRWPMPRSLLFTWKLTFVFAGRMSMFWCHSSESSKWVLLRFSVCMSDNSGELISSRIVSGEVGI